MGKRIKSNFDPLGGLVLLLIAGISLFVKYWQTIVSILIVGGCVYWFTKRDKHKEQKVQKNNVSENSSGPERSSFVFDFESPRLIQIIEESTNIITNTKNPRTAVGRHNDIVRCATRLFEIIPHGRKLEMEFNKRKISSIEDIYIVDEEKKKWLSDHGFPFDDEAMVKYSTIRKRTKSTKLAS